MRVDKRLITIVNTAYWVRDNNGIEHLYHDPVYSQWLEDRYKMEAKELAKEKNENKDSI
jgi:hypothetical protein